MNRISYRRIALSALLAALMTAPAFAQGEPEKTPPAVAAEKEGMEKEGMDGPMKHMRMSHEERFKKNDTDGDGFLTKEEMLNEHRMRIDEIFQRLDADKDGKLSSEEMKKGRAAMHEKMRERMKDHREEMEEKMKE